MTDTCCVMVTADGRTRDRDGDPIPFDRRPYECGKPAVVAVDGDPLCSRHHVEHEEQE